MAAAVCDERLIAIARTSRAPDGGCDPVSALRTFTEELVTTTNVYQGLAVSFGAVLDSHTPGCIATTEEGRRLLHRAQAVGIVRQDVTMEDLVFVITVASLASVGASDAAASAIRFVGLLLDGAIERE